MNHVKSSRTGRLADLWYLYIQSVASNWRKTESTVLELRPVKHRCKWTPFLTKLRDQNQSQNHFPNNQEIKIQYITSFHEYWYKLLCPTFNRNINCIFYNRNIQPPVIPCNQGKLDETNLYTIWNFMF